MLVEIKCISVRRNTTVFQIVEEINYMFRPFSGLAIIRLRLEYRIKLLYYNVYIKHGERDRVLQCLGGGRVTIYMRCLQLYRVFCKFIDTWAGVVFLRCFGQRWSVRSWVGFMSDCCGEDSRACEVIVFERGGGWW
jgi:hypothetical protein